MPIEDLLGLYVERLTEAHYRGPGMPWEIGRNYGEALRPTADNMASTFSMVF